VFKIKRRTRLPATAIDRGVESLGSRPLSAAYYDFPDGAFHCLVVSHLSHSLTLHSAQDNHFCGSVNPDNVPMSNDDQLIDVSHCGHNSRSRDPATDKAAKLISEKADASTRRRNSSRTRYRVVKSNTPLLSGGFIEYKSVISVLLLKVGTIVLNHPT
jgi:hypothetical protein